MAMRACCGNTCSLPRPSRRAGRVLPGGRTRLRGGRHREFGTAPNLWESRRARHERDVWGLLLSLPVPLVARLHGYCFGAGLELPLCCDVRVADEDARFALPEVTLGYIPSAGGTQTLPRTIPPGAAADLILTGEPVGTEAALRWGLITRAVPAGELDEAVEAAIEELLAGPFAPSRPRL